MLEGQRWVSLAGSLFNQEQTGSQPLNVKTPRGPAGSGDAARQWPLLKPQAGSSLDNDAASQLPITSLPAHSQLIGPRGETTDILLNGHFLNSYLSTCILVQLSDFIREVSLCSGGLIKSFLFNLIEILQLV